jgi:hypothetical protein
MVEHIFISSVMNGIWRSLCNVKFETYHGALVMVRSTFDWSLWIILVFDGKEINWIHRYQSFFFFFLFLRLYSPFYWALTAFSVSYFCTQSAGLVLRGFSPSQYFYLHTGQYKQNERAHRHTCLQWDLNHDPSIRTGEDSTCLRLRGYCDQQEILSCLKLMAVAIRNASWGSETGLCRVESAVRQKY